MKLTYKHTQLACYLGYVSQAIATTFLPLLFVRLSGEFGFTLSKLTVLIMIIQYLQGLNRFFCTKIFLRTVVFKVV